MKVVDLDILRPEPKIIRLGGNDIDVSFVPCGCTFEVDELVQRLRALVLAEDGLEKIQSAGPEAKEAFDISVKLCACFCAHDYPEMTVEWFYHNTDNAQVSYFASAIKDALMRAYNTGSSAGKNA